MSIAKIIFRRGVSMIAIAMLCYGAPIYAQKGNESKQSASYTEKAEGSETKPAQSSETKPSKPEKKGEGSETKPQGSASK